jgi:hypothetical protein
MFSNLLQVIFGIRSWTSGSDGAKAEDSDSETEAKEAPVAARSLLQVIFGIRSWTSGSDGAKAEDGDSETEAKGASVAARGLDSPEAIPLFGALGSALLVVFVGLMGWRAGRSGRD